MFREIWEAVKTGARKIGMEKAKGRRSERRSWEKEGREEQEKEVEKRKDNGSKKGSRGMENIG